MDQNSASTNPVAPIPTPPVSDVTSTDITPIGLDTTELANTAPVANVANNDAKIPDAPAPVPATTPDPATSPTQNPTAGEGPSPGSDIAVEVAKKIAEAQNVLIALSSNPSVDEMAAAIGLSLFLDRLGKRATAIYSGATPNALEFLKPEETFESSTDTLQDFVIALNKDKADHLRYKLDGEYVKIFITPYKTRIGEDDLEFSYGDFNVDLVLALDIVNGIDLDAALREHGRIMHDAVIVNITTGNPGKFGEIEWSDKSASSVSEMIARMIYSAGDKTKIEREEATAFLTGIVAATNRFSNAKTTPNTMQVSSDLMASGADQQLVSKNITPDVDNEIYSILSENTQKQGNSDPTKLDIDHNKDEKSDEQTEEKPEEEKLSNDESDTKTPEDTLLDDLKAAEASLAQAGNEIVPDTSNQPVKLDDMSVEMPEVVPPASEPVSPTEPIVQQTEQSPTEPGIEQNIEPSIEQNIEPNIAQNTETDNELEPNVNQIEDFTGDKPEKVLQPSVDFNADSSAKGTEKYSKMLEDALSGIDTSDSSTTDPIIGSNPASSMAPPVSPTPEINGVPEINYMPMPGEEVLPPPPTPPIDMDIPSPDSVDNAAPEQTDEPMPSPDSDFLSEPTPLGSQPAMQDQVYVPQATDPSAFKIPGV